jgi:hypothetical protein
MKWNSLSTHYCLKYTIDFVFGKEKNTRDRALPEIKNHWFPNPELVVKMVC